MGRLQVNDGQVQVALGRRKRPVTQHFLDVADIGAVLDQVRGAGVPPDVAGNVFLDPRQFGVAFDDVAQGVRVDRIAGGAQEQALAGGASDELGTDAGEVGFNEPAGHGTQRHYPVHATFAQVNPQQPLLQIGVGGLQVAQLRGADPSGVEHFQDGPVPLAEGAGVIR